MRLVNHKTYYYIVIAYGYNEYKHYDPTEPSKLDGQKKPYIASRKTASGGGISAIAAIPHNPSPENGGTLAQSVYGDQPQIKRIEGQGNGGNWLDLTVTSEEAIATNNFYDYPVYQKGKGPIQVKVVDPLRVQSGRFRVRFQDTITLGNLTDAYWLLEPIDGQGPIVSSNQTITVENEQLFLDYGISISIKQVNNPGVNPELGNGVLAATLEYDDPTKPWLGGFSDREGQTDGNWIRSGTSNFDVGGNGSAYNDYFWDSIFPDPNQDFERLINGTWGPYKLVSSLKTSSILGEVPMKDAVAANLFGGATQLKKMELKDLASVDIVFTNDKSKWSRAMVFESRNDNVLSVGNQNHLLLRLSPSVDKQGKKSGDPGYNAAEGDLVSTTSMGWFPGYVVNVETGQRLNIAFAEDSWLVGENGRDMKWNPTSTYFTGVNGELAMGGKHYIYVFREGKGNTSNFPAYDGCAALYAKMAIQPTSYSKFEKLDALMTCIWAGIPMLNPGRSLLETTARVKLRVEKPYNSFTTASTINGGLPLYEFDMAGFEVITNNGLAMDSALAMINVVPNPYYAYSEYETGNLDSRIKITNLPERCTISIYNVGGTLMRRFEKAGEKTSLDWDLKNQVNIPVAGGVYLIHVKVPGIGERTLKWFGVMRPTDLNGL